MGGEEGERGFFFAAKRQRRARARACVWGGHSQLFAALVGTFW
jgi:hypothetical protein